MFNLILVIKKQLDRHSFGMFSTTGIADCLKKSMWLKQNKNRKKEKCCGYSLNLKKHQEIQLPNAIHKPRLNLEYERKKK